MDPTFSLPLLFALPKLPVGLSVLLSVPNLFKLPVGDEFIAGFPVDPVGLCVRLTKTEKKSHSADINCDLHIDKFNSLASGRRFFSKLSALITFRPNSSANSDEMACMPTSGAVRRYADVTLTSRASEDFCRNISDGFTLRSNELDGLSESLI